MMTISFGRDNVTVEEGIELLRGDLRSTCSRLELFGPFGLRFGDEGARILADVLRTDETRTELFLNDNRFTSEGGKAIFDSLKSNTTLTTLNSINNPMNDDAAFALSEALKSNTTLTNIYVNPRGERALLESVLLSETILSFHCSPSFGENAELVKRKNKVMSLNHKRGKYFFIESYSNRIDDKTDMDDLKIALRELRSNVKIKSLCLERSVITPEISTKFRELMRVNKTIEELNLRDCNLDDSNSQILEGLEGKTNIKTLTLCGNKIQESGAQSISTWLITGAAPKRLDLTSCLSDGDSFLTVFYGIACSSFITSIDLSYNTIGDALLYEHIKNAKFLETLQLRYCKIERVALESIGHGVRENTHLKALNLTGNNLSSCGDVLENIAKSKSLISLTLNKCEIDYNSMIGLCEGLITNTTLNKNAIGPECCEAIASIIANSHVSSLNLACNSIGGDNARKIGRALKASPPLSCLNLSSNQLTDSCSKGFSIGLKINNFVHSIDLSYNKLTDEGAIRIGKIFKTNNVLSSLNLSGNVGITDKFVVEVYKTLKKINSTLKTLGLDKTSVSSLSIEKVKKAVSTPAVWKNPDSSRDFETRRRGDNDSDSDSDDDDVEYEPSAKQHCATVSILPQPSQPQPSVPQIPFMLAKEPLNTSTPVSDGVFIIDESKRKARHLLWESTDELCMWVIDMFPRCSDVLCAAFHEHGVTWDTLCGETREGLMKYGLSREDTNDFYECIKGEKLFLLPDEDEPYMSIVEVINALGYDKYKLDGKIGEAIRKTEKVRDEYGLSIGDIIIIALYTLNSGVNGRSLYTIINSKMAMRSARKVYRWYIYHLLFALHKLPLYQNNDVLYRGIPRDVDIEKKYKIGVSRKWLPFTSTSTREHIAKSFIGDCSSPTLFEIRGPVRGYDISLLSCFGKEHEVLLEPYFTFKTESVTDYQFSKKARGKKICVRSECRDEYFVPDESVKGIALLEPMSDGWSVDVDDDNSIIYRNGTCKTHISPNYTNYEVFKTQLDKLNAGPSHGDDMGVD